MISYSLHEGTSHQWECVLVIDLEQFGNMDKIHINHMKSRIYMEGSVDEQTKASLINLDVRVSRG